MNVGYSTSGNINIPTCEDTYAIAALADGRILIGGGSAGASGGKVTAGDALVVLKLAVGAGTPTDACHTL